MGDALERSPTGLGVEKVIVAVDDARLGRQVFCSARAPLGSEGIGLVGPQGAWTQPPQMLDDVAASVLVRAVGAGVVRSAARVPERSPATTASPALDDALATAAARAVRHGWGFTLVLVRGGARLAEVLGSGMRAADQLVVRDDNDVALVLPQTAGDRVPLVLARLTAGRDTPPFNYGLVCLSRRRHRPGRPLPNRGRTARAGDARRNGRLGEPGAASQFAHRRSGSFPAVDVPAQPAHGESRGR